MAFKIPTKSLAVLALTIGASWSATPAKSECVTSSVVTNCQEFYPTTTSDAMFFGYTDAQFVANTRLTDISFTVNGYTAPSPFEITNIQYTFDGINFTGLPDATIDPMPGTSNNVIPGTIENGGDPIGPNFQLKATIPNMVSPVDPDTMSFFIEAFVRSDNGSGGTVQDQTRDIYAIQDLRPAPAPLPLFGALTAFGFSRRLRTRIKECKSG